MGPTRLLLPCPAVLAAVLLAACSAASTPVSPSEVPVGSDAPGARYTVTFQATWSASTHPVEFPPGPHFSGLIGATHDGTVSFWTTGGTSSDGMRAMAETGSQSPLDAEVRAAMAHGRAGVVISGRVFSSPGSTSADFDISTAFPLVTLVSMIAPSPDWFVGVSSLDLRQGGVWIDERRVDLHPYDAGTDGGTTYLSPDLTLSPRQPIARITSRPLAPSGTAAPLGTFTFRRRS